MRFFKRWLFWVVAASAVIGVAVLFFITYGKWQALQVVYTNLEKRQGEVTKYNAHPLLPTSQAIELAKKLSDDYDRDIRKMVLDNYDRENVRTRFELLFADSGYTRDINAIDLNRYRSKYETERDIVLSVARDKGAYAVPLVKENSGFQYFDKNELSRDSITGLQKRFWISSAIYECLTAYNSKPLLLAGWKFVPETGDQAAELPARISAVKAVRQLGIVPPPDVSIEDPRYLDTRPVMEPFYYFAMWNIKVELAAPEGAVPGIVNELLNSSLFFFVSSISIKRRKAEILDRYALPMADIELTLVVLDFDETKLPEEFRPKADADVDKPEDAEGPNK
ncbi:MAG: hypothetical protein WC712_02325 [Candidatus Brocadiia bacterium]